MLDWLFPQTVEIIASRINGPVRVTRLRRRYAVWAGGFEQSGPLVESLWRKALKDIRSESPPRHILILGFGTGSAAEVISKKWPDSRVTGVEIDPVMISLGKKYFHLSRFPNLEIINLPALQCFKTLTKKKRVFDLILVDLYIGNKPALVKIPKSLLSKTGVIITNKLEGVKNSTLLETADSNVGER